MPIATSADEFLVNLRKSQLVDEPKLSAELDRLRSAGVLEPDPTKLAGHFIKVGLLTKFQAAQLIQGKVRGFLIGGKYRVLDVLGTGGMGHVLLCEHLKLKSVVAVKVLKLGSEASQGVVERFYREARAAFGLNHPNVARAFDIDQDGDTHYLVMEYIDGSSLQELVANIGPLPIGLAANVISQAALGLQEASNQGWVHRDIKPANLMLDRTGTVKVLDLGLARLYVDTKTDNITKQFDEKAVLGTVDYLAPEQTIDSSAVDIRADIYALGATLYFLLSQRTPFPDGSVAQKLLWHTLRDPDPLREARPDVPSGLDAVVRKMMHKKVTSRYQSPAEVVDALAKWADPTSPPPPEWMPKPRNLPGNPGTPTPRSGTSPVSSVGAATPMPRAASTRNLAVSIGSSRIQPRPGRSWTKNPKILGGIAVLVIAVAGAVVWGLGRGGKNEEAPPTGPGNTRNVRLPNGRFPLIIGGRDVGNKAMPSTLAAALEVCQPGDHLLLLGHALISDQVTLTGEKLTEIEIDGAKDENGDQGLWLAPHNIDSGALISIKDVKRLVIKNLIIDGGGRVDSLVHISGKCPGVRFENCIFKGFRKEAVAFSGASGGRDKGELLVLSRVRIQSDPAQYGGSPRAAFAFLAGPGGKANENIDIVRSRVDGAVQNAILIDGATTYVNFQENRFYRVQVGCRYEKAKPELPLRVNFEGNTFAEIKTAFRLETIPLANDVNRLLLRNNLFSGTKAIVEIGDAIDTSALKNVFEEARGNVRDPESGLEGSFLLPSSKLQPLNFAPLGTDTTSDGTFLRYPADSVLLTAGANGRPAGVPPP